MANITLKWKDRSVDEEGFKIYRSEEPFDVDNLPEAIVTLPPDTEEYVDEDVQYGIAYYYLIETFGGGKRVFSHPFRASVASSKELLRAIKYCDVGPKETIGSNGGAGFFGEVPTTELINGSGLASLIGLTDGTAQNNTAPWLKFFIDDRILYIPKMTYRHTISWDHLQAVNAVTGDRIITIGHYQYRIRLLKGLNPEPNLDVPYASGYDTEWTWNSEWNRLLYNVCEQPENPLHHKTSQIGDNWAEYTQNELSILNGNGRTSWCQETAPNNANSRVYRGGGAVTYLTSWTSSNATVAYGWRPVLELVVP